MKNVDEPILTIIVPSYNTSKYVDECVPSFCNHKLMSYLKVVFIDDGATDDTVEKLEKFINLYPDNFTIIRKQNGGHGSVINYGLNHCVKTKYFKVIDGDDWVNTDNLYELCQYLVTIDSDLIVSDFVKVFPNNEQYVKCQRKYEKNRTNFAPNYLITIHSATFKTTIFKEHKITVREKVFYEDNEYVLFPLPYVETISYFNKPVYYYRLGNSSQSVSKEIMNRNFTHACLVNDDINDYFYKICDKIPNFNGYKDIFLSTIGNFQIKKIVLIVRQNDCAKNIRRELRKFVKSIKNERNEVYKWLLKHKALFWFVTVTNCSMVRITRFVTRKMFE